MLRSLEEFDSTQEELKAAKRQVALLQCSMKEVEATNVQLKEEVSSLSYKLNWANFKCDELGHEISKLQRDAE